MKLSPSIYAADIVNLDKTLRVLEDNKVDMLHVDIMDGHFVNGMAFGAEHLKMLKNHTNLPLDVHLMVNQPERIIDQIAEAGADIISVHQESTLQLTKCLQKIKAHNKKAGVVLNPSTPPNLLKYVLEHVDMVLIMTVNPGQGGQKFHTEMLEKIKETKAIISDRDIEIEVDGSVDDYWALECSKAGATVIVSGSYLFSDLEKNISVMREKLQKTEGVTLQ